MDRQQPKLGLNLKVAQRQILTPGLVQMVTVLALNKLELCEMINEEMVANPLLEEVTDIAPSVEEVREKAESADAEGPALDSNGDGSIAEGRAEAFEQTDMDTFFNNYLDPGFKSPATEDVDKRALDSFLYENSLPPDRGMREDVEKPSFESFLSKPPSLADHLEWQLNLSVCSDPVRQAAISIIGNLNEDGYLTATSEEIAQTGGHQLQDIEEALKLVREFDPLGAAARDLKECLLIQLRALAPENHLAAQIISDHMGELENKQYKEIAKALDRPIHNIERCLDLIRTLDPRPGQRYNSVEPRLIEPEVTFVKVGDEYQVMMDEDGLPRLRVSRRYRNLLDQSDTTRDVRNYVKERFSSALQLLKNIEQRKQTIRRVCEAIIRRQTEFLDRGIDHLRPMMIKEVAGEVGVHPSTVSRAVANKYANTPQGVYELRYFFSEAVQGPSGGSTSLINLKRIVKKMIEEEEPAKPLTDEQLMARLHEQGIDVTRRTVAKYREDMRIPSTHQRRKKK
ncbi:MAG TPA: RNA polymerase factor sigma-54 [Terriglobia bacterium]|nr:RNA polymerase factor sigma-54 [Terriglobia bacterium]